MQSDDMPRAARDLVRSLDRAALATALPVQGGAWPYASLVLVAVDHDLSPVLLLSDLAEHTKAITADSRVSLLFDGTQGLEQPLTGPRITLVGRAERTADQRLGRRFLARHPDAGMYAGFKDFNFYRVVVERAHLVAGFGKIRWLSAAELAGACCSRVGRERGRDRASHERGPCRRRSALCWQAARSGRQRLADERHRR